MLLSPGGKPPPSLEHLLVCFVHHSQVGWTLCKPAPVTVTLPERQTGVSWLHTLALTQRIHLVLADIFRAEKPHFLPKLNRRAPRYLPFLEQAMSNGLPQACSAVPVPRLLSEGQLRIYCDKQTHQKN